MIGTLILLATLLFEQPVKTLVLQSGHRIEIQGDVLKQSDKAVFRNLNGVAYSLPISEIDMDATLGRSTDAKGSAPKAEAAEAAEGSSKKIKVSEEEKKALLEKLSHNHSGQAPPEPEAAPARDYASSEPARAKRGEGDEDAWRQRARNARENVRAAQDRLQTLEEQEQRLEMQVRTLMGLSDTEGFATLVRQLEDTRTMAGYAWDNVAAAQRNLHALEEEARVKDILPGWLR